MNENTSTFPRRSATRLAIAAITLAAASLPGCIEEDRLSAAIDEVSMKLESLGAPGTAIPGQQLRESTYTEAVSTLKPLVGEGNPDQKAAAWLLIARAELGLAADPAADAAETRREAAEALRGIRAELAAYREIAAHAAAADSFDPADEIAELQAHISERAEEASMVEAEMAAVQKQIADLEALEAQARAASDEFRNTEADLRGQAMSLSAREAEPIVLRAAEQRSRADELAAQADRRAAEADVLRPQISAFRGEIDRLVQQQTLLAESIQSLNDQRERTAAEARAYRDRAAEIAARVIGTISDADAYRAGPLETAHAAAYEAFEAAGSSASKATASRTSSKLLSAEIAHNLGGTAMAHAASLEGLRGIVDESINAAGIRDASLSSIEATLRAQARSARDRGADALRAARDDYQSAGVRGEGADRIDAIVVSINEVLGEDPEPAAEPDSEPAEESRPTDAQEPDAQDPDGE